MNERPPGNFEKDVLSKKTHDLDLLCGGLARQYRTTQPRSKRQKNVQILPFS